MNVGRKRCRVFLTLDHILYFRNINLKIGHNYNSFVPQWCFAAYVINNRVTVKYLRKQLGFIYTTAKDGVVMFHQLVYKRCPKHLLSLRPERKATLLDRSSLNFWQNENCLEQTNKLFIDSTIPLWNDLPNDLKEINNLKKFVSVLKQTDYFKLPGKMHYFWMGDKFVNGKLCQLRHCCSRLNNDKYFGRENIMKYCSCSNSLEDAEHYFLHCPNYNAQRVLLSSDCKTHNLTLDYLLMGTSSKSENELIIKAVTKYLYSTKRFS